MCLRYLRTRTRTVHVLSTTRVVRKYFRKYESTTLHVHVHVQLDSENFHAGAAAQILFMEPDTAGDFHIAPAPCAREAHMGSMNPVVGLLTT